MTIRFDADRTAHFFDRLPDNGEPNASTLVLIVLVYPFEHAEQAGMILGLDADAIVFNPEPDFVATFLRPNLDFRRRSRRYKFLGVVEQIRHRLRERRFMSKN